jgi:hypothetical protein
LQKEQFTHCDVCAYHESGHILFAYLCGYSCQEVQLIEGTNEDYSSYAIIEYGDEASIVSHFIDGTADIDFFNCLSLEEKIKSIQVGRKLNRIWLGGSVTAAIYNNDGNVHIPLPMQIDFADLLRVEFIHSVLKTISTENEENLVENGLQDALYTLSNVNLWETVTDLANRLLKQKQLTKGDIEECLEEHGIDFNEVSPLGFGRDA